VNALPGPEGGKPPPYSSTMIYSLISCVFV
jgi:hypothetical protein